ncbi:hypothetical protein ABEV74_02735 [Paenibacillus cisolokensis]|uniref:anti-sigma factor n=1 Tax=Paenibacillus cisolokensis TaxID=1658519 RepID=UPI003D2BCC7C
MKCQDVQKTLAFYWDLPNDAPERLMADAHIAGCPDCAEQFRLWEESMLTIRSLGEDDVPDGPGEHVGNAVMARIYSEQAWLRPVQQKSYTFTRKVRRRTAAIVACVTALFACGLLFLAFADLHTADNGQVQQVTGLLETANASADGIGVISAKFYSEIPVASVSDPIVLKVEPEVPEYTYWIALLVLGIVISLLLLGWLSRTRR